MMALPYSPLFLPYPSPGTICLKGLASKGQSPTHCTCMSLGAINPRRANPLSPSTTRALCFCHSVCLVVYPFVYRSSMCVFLCLLLLSTSLSQSLFSSSTHSSIQALNRVRCLQCALERAIWVIITGEIAPFVNHIFEWGVHGGAVSSIRVRDPPPSLPSGLT